MLHPVRLQSVQCSLGAADRDDEESPVRGNFDDRFGDRAPEDDAFEIENGGNFYRQVHTAWTDTA